MKKITSILGDLLYKTGNFFYRIGSKVYESSINSNKEVQVMETKDILQVVKDKSSSWNNDYNSLKQQTEVFLKKVVIDIKQITGEIPNEQAVFDIIRLYFDQKTNGGFVNKIKNTNLGLLNPIKDGIINVVLAIKTFAENQVLKIVDTQIIDRILGKDWYSKLIEKINEIK